MMLTSTLGAQILAFAAFVQVGSACMFATFGYNPCSGKVIGSIEDNGYYYGQILEQTPMEQISKPQGILISLTPTLRDQGYGAYVHEVRSEDRNSGYLSHVTIHQGPEGTEVGGFELVKDKNGHYSNALYGCDGLDDTSWFKRKPEYGGKGGWDRWGGQYPTFDINAAWVQCNPEPEQPVQFNIITAVVPVQTSGDGEGIVIEKGRRGGVQPYRERQNAKKNAAPVMITKTRNGIPQPEETGIASGNQGNRAPLPAPRGVNQGYRAYEKREADAKAATFFPAKLVDTLTQASIPYETGAPQLVSQLVEIAPGVEAQDNIRGGRQGFRGAVESNPGQAEWHERVSQGRLKPGQLEWQERVAQVRPGTEVVIGAHPAKRSEQQKRKLSKEEIKAMQDRDFLRRTQPKADKTQSKPNVQAHKFQGKKIIKQGVPTPERSAKIKRSDFAGLELAINALAHGGTHSVNHENVPDAMRKVEDKPTTTAAVETMQKIEGVEAWQWQKRGVAWNPDKLRQNKLTAKAMVPEGPRETGVRRYHTTTW